jgi:uncharacterized protein YceK
MRRVILLLLCFPALPGCNTLRSHNTSPKQVADPEKADAIQSMSAAEKEADQQLNKW